MPKPKTFFETISPKASFLLGVVTAVALFSLVGLISLSSVLISNSDETVATNTNTSNSNSAANTNAAADTGILTSISPDSIRYTKGSGDYTFIEYTDLECPFCKTFHETLNAIAPEYDGKVAFTLKHFPLNIHSKAKREAGAAECAGKQGKFFEYIDKVFEVTPSNNKLEDSQLFTIADELGLDATAFENCIENKEYEDAVTADAQEAMGTGGSGTPHSVLIDSSGTIITRFKGALPESQMRDAFAELIPE